MGEYADYCIDQLIEQELNFGNCFNRKEPDYSLFVAAMYSDKWTTQAGKTLKPNEMELGHLLNTMRMLERKASEHREKYLAYLNYLYLHGKRDNRIGSTTDEIRLTSSETCMTWLSRMPIYKALRKEYTSRLRSKGSLVDKVPPKKSSYERFIKKYLK